MSLSQQYINTAALMHSLRRFASMFLEREGISDDAQVACEACVRFVNMCPLDAPNRADAYVYYAALWNESAATFCSFNHPTAQNLFLAMKRVLDEIHSRGDCAHLVGRVAILRLIVGQQLVEEQQCLVPDEQGVLPGEEE